MKEKIWGQEIEWLDGNTVKTVIRNGILRKGEKVRVGLNKLLVDTMVRKGAFMVIEVLDPHAIFTIPAWKFRTLSRESILKDCPSKHMPIYEMEIPKIGYQVAEEEEAKQDSLLAKEVAER